MFRSNLQRFSILKILNIPWNVVPVITDTMDITLTWTRTIYITNEKKIKHVVLLVLHLEYVIPHLCKIITLILKLSLFSLSQSYIENTLLLRHEQQLDLKCPSNQYLTKPINTWQVRKYENIDEETLGN